jgi:hypothetical protein
MLITVADRSKAWNVFARSNTGIVGFTSTRNKDVCQNFSVFLSCVAPSKES